jgi:hypothetical protein
MSSNDDNDDGALDQPASKEGKPTSKKGVKKRLRELEKVCLELRTENRKLRAEIKKSKAYFSHMTKVDIMSIFDWNGVEANMVSIISIFSKDYLFARYKFLIKKWQKFDPENEHSFLSIVAKKILEYNADVRDFMNNYEDQWERIYVPVICQKYNTMRGNLNNEIRKQDFGEFYIRTI